MSNMAAGRCAASGPPHKSFSYTPRFCSTLSDGPATTRFAPGRAHWIRPGSASSLPRCSKPAASPVRRGPRACRAPARMPCASACPARRSIRPGIRRCASTPRASPIPSRPIRSPPASPAPIGPAPRLPPRRRVRDASASPSGHNRSLGVAWRSPTGHALSRWCRVAVARVSCRCPEPVASRSLSCPELVVSAGNPCFRVSFVSRRAPVTQCRMRECRGFCRGCAAALGLLRPRSVLPRHRRRSQ